MFSVACPPWFWVPFTFCYTVANIWQAEFKLYKIYLEGFAILYEKNVSCVGDVKFLDSKCQLAYRTEVLLSFLIIARQNLSRSLLQQTRTITRNIVCRICTVIPFFLSIMSNANNKIKLLQALMAITYWFMTFILLPSFCHNKHSFLTPTGQGKTLNPAVWI